MDEKKLARIFKVLSVETRVRMIHLLKDRALCVNALAKSLDITPAAVSQHLNGRTCLLNYLAAEVRK